MNTDKDTLKKLLKERFLEVELSDDQLDSLRNIEPLSQPKDVTPEKHKRGFSAFNASFSSWWAAACVSFILVLAFVFMFPGSNSSFSLVARISKEVSTNHLYAKPLDLNSSSLSEISQFFDRLDFNPVLMNAPLDEFKLIGGRYCTLQGQIALFLRFQDSKGEVLTYYLTKDSDTFSAIPGSQQTAQFTEAGVHVTMWREAGLVVATAVGV